MVSFSDLKDANKFRQLGNEMKKAAEQIFVTSEKQGMKVVVRGDKRIERIEIDGEEKKVLKDFLNDALKEVDKKLEKKEGGKMREMFTSGFKK